MTEHQGNDASFFRVPAHLNATDDAIPVDEAVESPPWPLIIAVIGAGVGFLSLPIFPPDGPTDWGIRAGAILGMMLVGTAGGWLVGRPWRRRDGASDVVTAAFASSSSGLCILDSHGHTVFSNAAMDQLAGTQVDGLGTLVKLFDREVGQAERFRRLVIAAASGATPPPEDLSAQSDGGDRWLSVQAIAIPDHPGCVYLRVDDATSRYEMTQILRQEQSALSDALDGLPVGLYVVDADGRFVVANRRLAGWLGVELSTLLSGNWRLHDMLHVRSTELAPYLLVDDADGEEGSERRAGLRVGGGGIMDVGVAQSLVRSPAAGPVVRARGVVRDLTGEQAAQATADRFRSAYMAAPIAIALLDARGQIESCNPAFERLAGQDGKPLQGQSLVAISTEATRSAIEAALAEERDGTAVTIVECVFNADGRTVPAQLFLRAFPALSAEVGTLVHAIDLSDQKRLELQFVQSQKMQAIGQLAGGVAHDFNNLLTAMIGFCDLLLMRHKPGDPSFADIMQIKQNANRAANLVRQLLAFSRQQTLQPRVLDVTDVLSELAHLIRRLIGENIELKIVHGRELGLVRVDQGQLEQVLINLCVNARDAMPSGGRLTISTMNEKIADGRKLGDDDIPAGDYVGIEVIDTGTGIPPDILSRIFEPFFSTKEVGSGTGLGLSTAYGIIKQTGGHIAVDSVVGEGTRFSIYLPRHESVEPVAPSQDETGPGRRESDLTGAGAILLVEDEDAVRMFSARALRNKGYQVFEARSGVEALDVLNTGERIDLLITDVVMPQMDGPTLIASLGDEYKDMHVIFISGYAEDRFRDHLDDRVSFLSKPFSLKQLAAKVKDVLEERA